MTGRISAPRRQFSWNALVLPLCIISLVLSGTALLSSNRRSVGRSSGSHWTRALNGLVLPSTARSVQEDEVLREHYVAAVDFSAGAADWLAARYPSKYLDQVRDLLDMHAREVTGINSEAGAVSRRVRGRALPNPLAALLPGGSGGAGGDSGGLLSSLGDALKNGLSGIGQDLLGDVASAGFFLGAGIGQGAATGLNLTTADKAKAVAAKVASSNSMNATGLNPTIQNLGNSLAGTLAGSVNISSLGGGVDIAPAAAGLATGIGTGVVTGLKIKQLPAPPPTTPNGTGIADIVSQFGFSLTDTIASNIDIAQLTSGLNTAALTQQLPGAALGLAQGLGNGAITGLQVNNVPPPQGTGVPDIASSFGYGLSQSVTSNIPFALIGQLASSQTGMLTAMLPAAASGLGKGLGEGIPIGLGFQPDMGVVAGAPMPNGSLDISAVTENFGMGLTSRILANGTLSKLMSMQSPGDGLVGSLDFGKVAGGFARGFLQGAGDAVTAMGGVQALTSGTSQMVPSDTVQDTPIQFNDSINGAAVGFGQGLGSQGVLVVQSLIQKAMPVTQTQKRSLEGAPTVDAVVLAPRQTDTTGMAGGLANFNLSALVDAETISTFVQKGIDILGCEGVGGLVLVLQGVTKSGALPMDATSMINLSKFKDMLPKGIVHFTSDRNNYVVDLTFIEDNLDSGVINAANGVSVNGNKVIQFVAFLVVHILFGIFSMLFLLPALLGLEGARNIFVRLRKPQHLTWAPKWVNLGWLLLIGPLLILVLIFGALANGSSGHFRTAHGIIGLLAVLDGLFAVLMHIVCKYFMSASPEGKIHTVRTLNNQVFAALASAATLTGFTDLSQISVCITRIVPFEGALSLGFGLASVYTIGTTVSQLDVYLMFKQSKHQKNGSGLEAGSGIKEKIKVVLAT